MSGSQRPWGSAECGVMNVVSWLSGGDETSTNPVLTGGVECGPETLCLRRAQTYDPWQQGLFQRGGLAAQRDHTAAIAEAAAQVKSAAPAVRSAHSPHRPGSRATQQSCGSGCGAVEVSRASPPAPTASGTGFGSRLPRP